MQALAARSRWDWEVDKKYNFRLSSLSRVGVFCYVDTKLYCCSNNTHGISLYLFSGSNAPSQPLQAQHELTHTTSAIGISIWKFSTFKFPVRSSSEWDNCVVCQNMENLSGMLDVSATSDRVCVFSPSLLISRRDEKTPTPPARVATSSCSVWASVEAESKVGYVVRCWERADIRMTMKAPKHGFIQELIRWHDCQVFQRFTILSIQKSEYILRAFDSFINHAQSKYGNNLAFTWWGPGEAHKND